MRVQNSSSSFWLSTPLLLLALLCTVEVTAQLLPSPLGRTATNSKTFENGVVTCGSTFCDSTRCRKKLVKGKTLYECEEQ